MTNLTILPDVLSAVSDEDIDDQLAEAVVAPTNQARACGREPRSRKSPGEDHVVESQENDPEELRWWWWRFSVKGGVYGELDFDGKRVMVAGSLTAIGELGKRLKKYDPGSQV